MQQLHRKICLCIVSSTLFNIMFSKSSCIFRPFSKQTFWSWSWHTFLTCSTETHELLENICFYMVSPAQQLQEKHMIVHPFGHHLLTILASKSIIFETCFWHCFLTTFWSHSNAKMLQTQIPKPTKNQPKNGSEKSSKTTTKNITWRACTQHRPGRQPPLTNPPVTALAWFIHLQGAESALSVTWPCGGTGKR